MSGPPLSRNAGWPEVWAWRADQQEPVPVQELCHDQHCNVDDICTLRGCLKARTEVCLREWIEPVARVQGTSLMPSDTLSTQSRLADIRLRVINREIVTTDEYRDLLLDLRRDRDATARNARSASAAKRKANTVKPPQSLDLNTLFSSS